MFSDNQVIDLRNELIEKAEEEFTKHLETEGPESEQHAENSLRIYETIMNLNRMLKEKGVQLLSQGGHNYF